jgi:hypothetical protein
LALAFEEPRTCVMIEVAASPPASQAGAWCDSSVLAFVRVASAALRSAYCITEGSSPGAARLRAVVLRGVSYPGLS